MLTLTITNTPYGHLTPESEIILEDGTHVPIPEALPNGSKTAPRRIAYTLGQHGYMLSTKVIANSLHYYGNSSHGDITVVDVRPMTLVSSTELAEVLWPGCLDGATPKEVERYSASARRWARRAAVKDPGMEPQSRVEIMSNGRQRAMLVWRLELAMRIRISSLGSGNWKQPDAEREDAASTDGDV